ncbi:MAG: response regulator, partial [Rhodospirillaceae bacterium]|nr:response regulator [Rhodospirillaceae bacterium]
MLVQVDRGRTAIIVEDDSIMAEYVNEMLSLLGYNTFVCVDYESAKIFFDPQQTAVVVADIFTPGIGGIEGIKLVREALPDTHIIAM